MTNSDIINLQETSPDKWQAKYRGNYGVYTIRIRMKGNKMEDYSCSCPSDYYPCKHIPMVAGAIKQQIGNNRAFMEKSGERIKNILDGLSLNELREFFLDQISSNQSLANTFLLKFSHIHSSKHIGDSDTMYNEILRNILDKISFDYEDFYEYDEYESGIEIDELSDWLKKAQKHIEKGNYSEAEKICKACIEEYAEWLNHEITEVRDYVSPDYEEMPFSMLQQMSRENQIDTAALYVYVREEMKKSKYDSSFLDKFNDLLSQTAKSGSTGDEFIATQENLLKTGSRTGDNSPADDCVLRAQPSSRRSLGAPPQEPANRQFQKRSSE